jgi:hypothetical protein
VETTRAKQCQGKEGRGLKRKEKSTHQAAQSEHEIVSAV